MRNGEVCRVTRRNKPGDYGLAGGKVDPTDSHHVYAMIREVLEEIGVEVIEAYFIFERIDPADGKIAWCYRVTAWKGEPHQCEPGIEVSWGKPETLLTEDCTFREYNRMLFEHLELV